MVYEVPLHRGAFFACAEGLEKDMDGQNMKEKYKKRKLLGFCSVYGFHNTVKEAVSDPGYNIWFFSYYLCGSLVDETMFYIFYMLPRAFVLLTKYWRSCLDHLPVPFQL